MTPAGWYPDPSQRYEMRHWDGAQWTQHVVTAGEASTDPLIAPALQPAPRHRRIYGWLTVVFALVAVAAIAIPGIPFVLAPTGPAITLDSHRQELDLPAHTTFGVYINDADDSGYALSCSANSADGMPIQLTYPRWHLTSSETEMLSYVFDTGSGNVAMKCLVSGEQVTVRPVRAEGPLALGVVVGGFSALMALVMLILCLTRADPATSQVATARPE